MTSRLTSALLEAAREQGRMPENDPTSTDSILLTEADRQMSMVFVPMVRHARSDWYIAYQDQTLTDMQQEYLIPSRAVSSTVRAIMWLLPGAQEIELVPVPLTERFKYAPGRGAPCVYTIQDDRIVILPTPTQGLGTLRIWYERAPSTLVSTAVATPIASISSYVAPTLVVNLVDGSALGAPTSVDIVSVKAPFSLKVQDTPDFALAGDELTVTVQNGGRVPAVGDWVCTAGETVIPQLPDELHPLLSLAVAAEWLSRIDPPAGAALKAELADRMIVAQSLLASRQLGRQMKLKSEHSMMRRGASRRRGFSDWHS